MVKLLKTGHTVDYGKLNKIPGRQEAAAPAAAEASASAAPFGMERDQNGQWVLKGFPPLAPEPYQGRDGQDVMSISSMPSTPRGAESSPVVVGDS